MLSSWRHRLACAALAFSAAAASTSTAFAERWPGTTASIGGAIAARVIAIKCKSYMTSAEIAELDSYIEKEQMEFMSESAANTRLAETAFPRIARNYDYMYSQPDACTDGSRAMVRDMLTRVRGEHAAGKQAGLTQ